MDPCLDIIPYVTSDDKFVSVGILDLKSGLIGEIKFTLVESDLTTYFILNTKTSAIRGIEAECRL